jgi:hypothetical protein
MEKYSFSIAWSDDRVMLQKRNKPLDAVPLLEIRI